MTTRSERVAEAVPVEIAVSGLEPVRFLFKGATEAAGMFATLTEAEQDALPDAALFGIARLRGAIAEFTDEAPAYRGTVILEWPPPGPSPYAAMLGRQVQVIDAVAGKPITTCSAVNIRASAVGQVAADLILFADEDGNPLLEGQPVVKDGEILNGVFPFYIAEMRVRSE